MSRRPFLPLCLLLAACAQPSAESTSVAPDPIAQAPASGGPTALVPGQPDIGLVFDDSPGLWHPLRDEELTEEQIAEAEALGTLPYLAGSSEAPESTGGVVRRDESALQPGLNLVVSGHAPAAMLVDAAGEVVHEWSLPFSQVVPTQPESGSVMQEFWRRAWVYPNGDLLALFENIGLARLDKDSNQLWYYSGKPHHDVALLDDGGLYTLTQRPTVLDFRGLRKEIIDNHVTRLDADGNEIRSISIAAALMASDYQSAVFQMLFYPLPDALHVNSLELLDGSLANRIPAFRAGNLLISSKNLNFIAVLDPEQERIVWALFNLWGGQHDPTVLPDGSLLVFDNYGLEDRSRVSAVDPETQQITWSWGGTPDQPLYSKTCGLAQGLDNGNVLITESNAGRAIEVDAEGTVVWEYLSPYRAGDNGELIASLFQLERLGSEIDPSTW